MSRSGSIEANRATYPTAYIQLLGLSPEATCEVLRVLELGGYQNVVTLPPLARSASLVDEVLPGVVVLDVGRGTWGDLTVLRGLFEQRSPDVLVLAVSESRSLQLRAAALTAGASDHLPLPSTPSTLLQKISHLVEVLRAHRELRSVQALPGVQNSLVDDGKDPVLAEAAMLSRVTRLVDRHDRQLGQHTRRVAITAAETAKALGCSASFVAALKRAAGVHDLGKIMLPRAVLEAKGPLKREETAVMRSHPIIGANMLTGGTGGLLQVARNVALTHHERWDGNGYPSGLAGKGIPIEGRVVAVADAFDAITNDRVYRDAQPVAVALDELARCAGTQFDPQVVEAFITLQNRGATLLGRPSVGS